MSPYEDPREGEYVVTYPGTSQYVTTYSNTNSAVTMLAPQINFDTAPPTDTERLHQTFTARVAALTQYDTDRTISLDIAECLWTLAPIRMHNRMETLTPVRDEEDEGWIVVCVIAEAQLADNGESSQSWSFDDTELYIEEYDWLPGDPTP